MDFNEDDDKKKSDLAEGPSEQSDHLLPRFRIPTLRRASPNRSSECSSSSGGSSSASASSSRRDSPPQRPESQRSSSTFIEQQPTMKSSQRSKTPAAETLQSWFSSTERQQEVNEGQPSARFQPPSLRRTDAAWQDRLDDPINSSGPIQPFSQGSSTISDSGEEGSLMWRPSFPAFGTHSVLLQESEGPGPSSRQPPELLRLTHPFVRRDTQFWRLSTPPLPSFRDTPPLNTMNDPSVEPLEETLFSGLHSPSENSSPSILDSNSLDENAKVKARAPFRTIPKTSGIDITNKWARKRATFRAPKKRIAAGHEELARQESSIKRMKVDEESSAGDSSSDPPAKLEVVPPPQLKGVPQQQQQQALEEFSITLTRLLNYSAPQRLRVWGAREEQTISQLISKKQAKSYGKKLAHLNNSYKNQDDPFLKAAVQRLAIFFEEAQTLYEGHYTQTNLEEFQAQVEGAQLLENAIVMAKITGKSIKELCEETIENLSPARP